MDATIEIEDGTDELAELESLSTWLTGVTALLREALGGYATDCGNGATA